MSVWTVGIWYGGEPDVDASDVFDEALSPPTTVFRTREAAAAHVEDQLREAMGGNPYVDPVRVDEVDLALEARTEPAPEPGPEILWDGDRCYVRGTEDMAYPPSGVIRQAEVEG